MIVAAPKRKPSRKRDAKQPPSEPAPLAPAEDLPAPVDDDRLDVGVVEAEALSLADVGVAPAAKPPAKKESESGLACPKCGCKHVPVVYTRHALKRTVRRRECRHCAFRFTTTEKQPDIFGGGSTSPLR